LDGGTPDRLIAAILPGPVAYRTGKKSDYDPMAGRENQRVSQPFVL